MTEHPNVTGIRRVFDAFRGGDSHALVEVIAEDAVWQVGGRVPVSRTYTGRRDIFELFRLTRKLTDGTYTSRLRWAVADDDHGVALYRASGRRGERSLDIDQALLIGFRDGKWAQITAVPTDPVAFETFWA